jgi:hypothetical protein
VFSVKSESSNVAGLLFVVNALQAAVLRSTGMWLDIGYLD